MLIIQKIQPPLRIHTGEIHDIVLKWSPMLAKTIPANILKICGRLLKTPVTPKLNPRMSYIKRGDAVNMKYLPHPLPNAKIASERNGIDVIMLPNGGHV